MQLTEFVYVGECHELGRGRKASAKETPYCAPHSEKHEVRCCSSTAINGFTKTSCRGTDLWTESDSVGFGGCQHSMTFDQADELCKSMSARLCTKDELEGDCAAGTGCLHDEDLIWSSTPSGMSQ